MELFDVKLETIVEKSIDDGSTTSDDATERGDEEGIAESEEEEKNVFRFEPLVVFLDFDFLDCLDVDV